ncbi:hypothetical protein SEA_MELPOMINI_195 [Mycobacterium phage Melpomini]|nr:hypothetical protein SEA_MELPOMINI_195 [Mycobacterium phage Melpomini]
MAFVDPDPIEEDMGVRCQEMSPEQLVSYIKTYHGAFGLDLPVEGLKERSIFRGLQKTYGPEKAGQIVKWTFYRHKGKFRGQTVGYFDFIKARKWFTDLMLMESTEELARQAKKITPRQTVGAKRLSDL